MNQKSTENKRKPKPDENQPESAEPEKNKQEKQRENTEEKSTHTDTTKHTDNTKLEAKYPKPKLQITHKHKPRKSNLQQSLANYNNIETYFRRDKGIPKPGARGLTVNSSINHNYVESPRGQAEKTTPRQDLESN